MRADDHVDDYGYGVHRDGRDQCYDHGVDANDEHDPSGLNDHGLREADVHDQYGFCLHENRVSEPSGSSDHGLCGIDVNDPHGHGLRAMRVSEPSGHDHRESVRGVHGQRRSCQLS